MVLLAVQTYPSAGVLDAFQRQGRYAGVAAHHHVPVQGLPGRGEAMPGSGVGTAETRHHCP